MLDRCAPCERNHMVRSAITDGLNADIICQHRCSTQSFESQPDLVGNLPHTLATSKNLLPFQKHWRPGYTLVADFYKAQRCPIEMVSSIPLGTPTCGMTVGIKRRIKLPRQHWARHQSNCSCSPDLLESFRLWQRGCYK